MNKFTIAMLSLLAFSSVAFGADDIYGLGGNNTFRDNTGRIWGATVIYTTDGAGNPIPVGSSSALPPGAATSANQTTGNNSLSSIDGKTVHVDTGAVVVASSALPSGAATSAGQTTGNNSLATLVSQTVGLATAALQSAGNATLSTISSTLTSILSALQGTLTVAPTSNSNGSISNNASVTTTASTFTVPANAVGFLLEAESGNTANIRWAIGSTATASVGTLTEPGRDTGYIPGAANISVIAISGTQSVSVQWILRN